MCTYCAKWFPKGEVKPLPLDDSPQLERLYCSKCFPEVEAAHLKLPWIKKNIWGEI